MRSSVKTLASFALECLATTAVAMAAIAIPVRAKAENGPAPMTGRSVAVPRAPSVHAFTSLSAMRNAFGGAVLVGDGEVFVGEPQNQFRASAVYVYRKVGAAWKQAATLTAPKSEIGAPFGTALALEGTWLYVAAGPAAVHAFRKTGTTWSYASTIDASQAGTDAKFGNAIAVSGDWLMIGRQAGGRGGAPAANSRTGPPLAPSGAVYAFRRGGNGQYSFHSTIARPDSVSAGDQFGTSVGVSGNIALIGATGQSTAQGIVHEYNLDAGGVWQLKRSFTPFGVGNNDNFGAMITMQGQYAVVSAPGDGGGYGAAYLFHKVSTTIRLPDGTTTPNRGIRGSQMRDDSAWVELTRLTGGAGTRNERFGNSIAITDRDVIVTTRGADFFGSIIAFTRDTLGVAPSATTIPTGLKDNVGMAGLTMSARGNVLAVGAPATDHGIGSVLIYERTTTGAWTKQTVLKGSMDELTAMTGKETQCDSNGHVGVFECGNSSLVSFLPPSKLTADGHFVDMNDLWGWTDPVSKKEWALMGRMDGTTFVDISDPQNPIPVADLPLTPGARPAAWRDIKVYKDHAFIVSDGSGDHGMQVFDLTHLRKLKPLNGHPVLVKSDTVYHMVHSVHNIVINEESGFAYAVGSSSGGTTCGGGLHMIDIHDPMKPTFAGCFSDTGTGRSGTGYSHDAQCVMYHGPDTRYSGHEICIGSNETAVSIADVTDKKNPKALSHAGYPNNAYAHQGWLTEDHKYFYLDDELDELDHPDAVNKTRTLVWDFTDLENPRLVKEYMGVQNTTDHNLYVLGKQIYQANYLSGLRVLDISDPVNPREVSFFDTAPFHPNAPGFDGAWSVYPYFKSGVIVVNSISQGMFIIKQSNRVVF